MRSYEKKSEMRSESKTDMSVKTDMTITADGLSERLS